MFSLCRFFFASSLPPLPGCTAVFPTDRRRTLETGRVGLTKSHSGLAQSPRCFLEGGYPGLSPIDRSGQKRQSPKAPPECLMVARRKACRNLGRCSSENRTYEQIRRKSKSSQERSGWKRIYRFLAPIRLCCCVCAGACADRSGCEAKKFSWKDKESETPVAHSF
ncbi:hypothetical protein RRG08_048543 [Elysia crispata]|uniref:Secreted protein n=1 Tax=Elysia crispata TaxID=231223 RepID=A0AAE1B555_9GAST|nr:hypothetical protein RRG08_048543 [Elysia crispata]